MMRQADIPERPSLSSNNTAAALVEVTDDQRIEILCSQKRDAIMKLQAKKEMLSRFFTHRKDLIEDAKTIDADSNTDIASALERELPKGKNYTISNQDASTKLTNLYQYITILDHQMTALNRASRSETRSSKAVLVSEFMNIMRKVDTKALNSLANAESDPLLKGVTLSASQQESKFMLQRVPKDEAYSVCIFCNHRSINEPTENDTLVEVNSKKLKDYQEQLNLWNQYCNDVDKAKKEANTRKLPAKPKYKGKQINGKPRYPRIGKPILQCMCLNSACCQIGSQIGSTCPIQCRDENGEVYAAETDGSCSCPRCKCKCNKAYHPDDIAKIVLRLQQRDMVSQDKESPEIATANFMRSLFTPALHSAAEARSVAKRSSKNLSDDDLDLMAQEQFYSGAAMNALSYAEKMSVDTRDAMKKSFGSSTVVTLPNGARLDTRSIGRNTNSHAKNNKLGSIESNISPLPGMEDSLRPSYKNVDSQFHKAAMGLSNPYLRTTNSVIEIDDSSLEENEKKVSSATPSTLMKERMLDRCRRDKQMGFRKRELTKEGKEKRKTAKKVEKHLLAQQDHRFVCRQVGKEMNANNDSEMNNLMHPDSGWFDSQQAICLYEEGFMSDDSN